jgi:hypothetical protein
MKTGELWIEQVLIGGLGIAVVALPWLPELLRAGSDVGTVAGLAGGSIALGIAFWLGIPLDRLADTLTDRLDRHARLRFALKRAKGQLLPREDPAGRLSPDLAPEDRLRVAGLRDSEAAAEWLEYHRSRVRLTRALAVYGPAVTLALVIGLQRLTRIQTLTPAWLLAILIAYVVWPALSACRKPLPRTDEREFLEYARTWGFVDGDRLAKPARQRGPGDLAAWLSEGQGLVAPAALLLAALACGWSSGHHALWLAAGAGTAMTVLSAWAWWRIGMTYRTYLYQLDHYRGAGGQRR